MGVKKLTGMMIKIILIFLILILLVFTPYYAQIIKRTLYWFNGIDRSAQTQAPQAIVILGGGLDWDKQSQHIIVNEYSAERLKKLVNIANTYHHLPIILSGVEAPYMKQWLKERADAKHLAGRLFLEKKSMNTCENARFTTQILQEKQYKSIILITDEYHMPRSQRLFRENGIQHIIPISAELPKNTVKTYFAMNYDHSRRANYELLAVLRDRIFEIKDCRESP